MQARGRPYTAMVPKASSSPEETSTLLQNSVLKKSQTRSTMTNFPKYCQLTFSDAVRVFMDRCPVTQSPQRNAENFIMRAKISKKKWKEECFKVNEKCKTQTLESGSSKKKKLNTTLIKPIYTCFFPKQKPFVLWKAWREITKVREKIHEGLSEGEPVSKGCNAHTREHGAHRGRNALATSPQCKINKGATHTARELKKLVNWFYILVEG